MEKTFTLEELETLYQDLVEGTLTIASTLLNSDFLSIDSYLREDLGATDDEIVRLFILLEEEFSIVINLPVKRVNDVEALIDFLFKTKVMER